MPSGGHTNNLKNVSSSISKCFITRSMNNDIFRTKILYFTMSLNLFTFSEIQLFNFLQEKKS